MISLLLFPLSGNKLWKEATSKNLNFGFETIPLQQQKYFFLMPGNSFTWDCHHNRQLILYSDCRYPSTGPRKG